MKFLQTAIFLFISFFSCAQNSTQQLHQNIAAVFKQQQGDFAISFKDLSGENDNI